MPVFDPQWKGKEHVHARCPPAPTDRSFRSGPRSPRRRTSPPRAISDMFERAARDPDGFWAEQSRRIAWMKAPTRIKNASFAGNVSIKWFEDGTLNASASCLDRHLATRGDQTAIIWESDDPVGQQARHLSRTARAGLPAGQRDEGARRQAGRSRHDLSADGARGRGGDARLRADRRGSFRGVRRVLARQPGEPHPGLRVRDADHRR